MNNFQVVQFAALSLNPMILLNHKEEFAVILPNTSLDGAIAVAQKIQAQIWQVEIPHSGSKVSQFVTLSLGITSLIPNPETTYVSLIKQVDEALYLAKQQGRDRFQVAVGLNNHKGTKDTKKE